MATVLSHPAVNAEPLSDVQARLLAQDIQNALQSGGLIETNIDLSAPTTIDIEHQASMRLEQSLKSATPTAITFELTAVGTTIIGFRFDAHSDNWELDVREITVTHQLTYSPQLVEVMTHGPDAGDFCSTMGNLSFDAGHFEKKYPGGYARHDFGAVRISCKNEEYCIDAPGHKHSRIGHLTKDGLRFDAPTGQRNSTGNEHEFCLFTNPSSVEQIAADIWMLHGAP
jgi:hypothetical protein